MIGPGFANILRRVVQSDEFIRVFPEMEGMEGDVEIVVESKPVLPFEESTRAVCIIQNPQRRNNMIEYIQGQLPRGELLCQLAEEASELSKAALKLRRAEGGTNPTPVTVEEAMENLMEEIGDVLLVLDVLEIDYLDPKLDAVWKKKLTRWAERLEEARQKREASAEEFDMIHGCPF